MVASSLLNYDAAFRDAHDRISHAADAIREYALKVFETDELILDHIAEHVAGMDWSELVRSEEFHRYLKLFSSSSQVSSVGFIARDHGLAATNPLFPAPSDAIEAPGYLPVELAEATSLYQLRWEPLSWPQFVSFEPLQPKSGSRGDLHRCATRFRRSHYRSIAVSRFLVTMPRPDGAVPMRSG
jgi:hypothetical protein